MHLDLGTPNWPNLTNESAEADWLADRDRKASYVLQLSTKVLHTAQTLHESNALFSPNGKILSTHPFSIDWYISLAGISLKTLSNLKEGPENYGLTRRIRGIRDKLVDAKPVSDANLQGAVHWLTDQINSVWPSEDRQQSKAIVMVSAILGGRAIGHGQNVGGNEAVDVLKAAIIDFGQRHSILVESLSNGQWERHSAENPALLSQSISLKNNLVCEFFIGGDTPDVKFTNRHTGRVLAVGEVKGRKDKSNIWESWMPQVADHMNTWSTEYQQSARLFFGTLITPQMINGESARGSGRRGFQYLHEDGQLNGVYNLTKITGGDGDSIANFDALITRLISQ
ncbi:hypothetical protein [Umezawaea beigongshangensis]|uniref:hypothetical protein n=1 Tax=Umezawaea beigongshangensis TaxID=2780383 RepID=UPI0018F22881|nr:hypothetical protein [Umezawaea beigongshangensis]